MLYKILFPTGASLFLFFSVFLMGCEDSGIVGSEIGTPDAEIQSMVVDVTGFEVVSENGFSGKLSYSATGRVNDPVYGDVTASTLLKPALTAVGLDSILLDTHTMQLRVVLDSERYGLADPAPSGFAVYEAGSLWRGNELYVNEPVPSDISRELGSFTLMTEDTAIVPLDPLWVEAFAAFFNDTSDTRSERYKQEFRGLSIAPVNVTDQMRFFRYDAAIDDSLNLGSTRFEIVGPDSAGTDSVYATISPLDWGASIDRTPATEAPEGGVVLLNTFESVIKTTLDIDPAQFEGKEIVNAQLTLHVKAEEDDLLRPDITTIRVHRVEELPGNLGEYLFTTTPQFAATAVRDEDDETLVYFNINLTGLVFDELYGDSGEGALEQPVLYISIQANNGKLYSATLVDETGPEEKRPRLTVTYIETNQEN